MSDLSPGNQLVARALTHSLGAIHLLDEAGSTVQSITVRSGTPILTIDKPPQFVKGAMTVSRPIDDGAARETRLAAPYRGCQVEWVERREAAQGRRAAR